MHAALGGCLLLLLTSLAPSVAYAQFADCGLNDAPAPYNAADCQGVCTQTGSEVHCQMETLCANMNGSSAAIVTGFGGSTHDMSAWGACLSTNILFCCVIDEGGTAIDTVTLSGTEEADEVLRFQDGLGGPNPRNLEPWDGDPIHGFIRGLAGPDMIYGSDYAPIDYDETLIGHLGGDIIGGFGGGDFLRGDDGDDIMTGGGGNDRMWGGDGNDSLSGGADDDKLCDASGYDSCAQNGGNYFSGGDGNDRLWYNESENPFVPCPGIDLNSASTAGNGTDECGDANDYVFVGLSCDANLTVEPTLCDGAH